MQPVSASTDFRTRLSRRLTTEMLMPKMTPMMLLKQDHQKVKTLLAELNATTERAVSKRIALRQQIFQEIKTHTALEEELFYPAFHTAAKKRENDKLFFEALEEHRAADMVLADLMRADPSTLSFAGKAKVLRELIEHHIMEEEDEMFPLAKKLLSVDQLTALAASMEQRKMELTSGKAKTRVNGTARRRTEPRAMV